MNPKVFHRALVVFLSVLFTCGLSACQPKEKEIITVGVINFVAALEPVLDGFRDGMAELGYVEGDKIVYIYDGAAGDLTELDQIAKDLVDSNADIILSISTPATLAAQRATAGTTIPVVFAPVTDPVNIGFVKSLSNPGGNLTGVTNLGSESRRLEWLLKLAPGGIKRIYIPYNSEDASARASVQTARAAAQELGVELLTREATDGDQMKEAISEIPEDVDAVFMLPEGLAINHIQEFVTTAIERKLPLAAPTTTQVEAGALVSYGLDLFSAGKQAARLADQILRGTLPAVLPVEEAEFYLAINLKTAEAISLEIPESILSQADEIFR